MHWMPGTWESKVQRALKTNCGHESPDLFFLNFQIGKAGGERMARIPDGIQSSMCLSPRVSLCTSKMGKEKCN